MLLAAAVDHVASQAVVAMDAADLDHAPPVAALLRFMDAGWQTFAHDPLLLAALPADPMPHHCHQPVLARLERLIRCGQDTGDFDRWLSASWLTMTVIGLGHTAGQEATAALKTSILCVFGAAGADYADQHHDPTPADPT